MSYSALGNPSYAQKSMQPLQQTVTPETSPRTPRYDPSRFTMTSAIPFNPYPSNFSTPKPSSSSSLQNPSRFTTPPSSLSSPANLSSPFADKLAVTERQTHNIFSSYPPANSSPLGGPSSVPISAPPISPASPGPPPLAAPAPLVGGEMQRIRQAMMQNQLAQYQEAEARRPEYLTRAKRPLSESDPPVSTDDDGTSRRPGVGIMDSPHKGRRITLFQETSEESFEESLMAGGYGRYRTADWVRQPQQTMAQTPGSPGPSTAPQRVEKAPEAPPLTEQELRKRKRLEAFRANETTNTGSDLTGPKLFPVVIEGKGRVLIDALSEEQGLVAPRDDATNKGGKRSAANNKKAKKKPHEPSMRERRAMLYAAAALADATDKPNWSDTEFPWYLRRAEREELTKEEDAHRLKLISDFMERDTDEEDASGEESDKHELLSSTAWEHIHEEGAQKPAPARWGRGKVVRLAADPHADRRLVGLNKRSRFFPTDPGDARAALLSKKSVRSLSYRQQRRQREQNDDSDEEVLCICRNKKDNSQVVQCDHCQTWYHLRCLGIPNIAALGREEDPFFCEACMVPERSESSDSEDEGNLRAREPTFVPTDNEPPRESPSRNEPLFQPSTLQDSPMPWQPPRTPTRPTRRPGPAASASESPFQRGPLTPSPQYSNRRQIFSNDTADDMPFDPTSTPSRGLEFFGGFTTPKWQGRAHVLFQTPSKRRDSRLGGPGTLDESAGGGGVFHSAFRRLSYDDSPIRRDTAPAGDGQRARRLLESPSVGGRHVAYALTLEESPLLYERAP
ncbi:hypothetical protein FB45DRAFT_19992 [Roridomyces roridus]|uniref:PHD-type domain-containing protein n=1 Tax=Roridomyces roridus TaxID=1738132 RepID=A0AAD7FYQ2_9AGAR|nr:hypothetical protein FB45DRAFT_19992 [Roridomyces roridus]